MIDTHSGTRIRSVTLDVLPGCPLYAALRNAIRTAFDEGCRVTFVYDGQAYDIEPDEIIAWVAKKG